MNPILIDMNLSPGWVAYLAAAGVAAVHWSTVGPIDAPDADIMAWAAANGRTVLTHDLDFGTLLALTGADGPSVVQVRSQNVMPAAIGAVVVNALHHYAAELAAGALVVVEPRRNRVRVLPL